MIGDVLQRIRMMSAFVPLEIGIVRESVSLVEGKYFMNPLH